MKITIEKKTILELDSEEAHWLRVMLQNALYETESEEDRKMRERFFSTLQQFTL